MPDTLPNTPAPPPGFQPISTGPASPAAAPPPPPTGFTPIDGTAQPQQRDWLDSVKDFVKNAWEQNNPVGMVKGAAQFAAHPLDTYLADSNVRAGIMDRAKQSFQSGDHVRAGVELFKSMVPFLGPSTQEATDKMDRGQWAAGLGHSFGLGLSLAGPEALGNAGLKVPKPVADLMEKGSEKMYQGVLKPPPGSFTPAEVETMVKRGVGKDYIPINALDKLNDLVDKRSNAVAAEIKAGSPMKKVTTPKPSESIPSAPKTLPPKPSGGWTVGNNYNTELSKYTDVLHHETSVDNALPLIPGGGVATDLNTMYFSNKPELATGQGSNVGVKLEFEPKGVKGQVNLSKPMAEAAYDQGVAEFISRYNNQRTLQDNLKAITIDKNAQVTRGSRMRMNLTRDRLENAGWTKTDQGDSIRYERPSPEAATEETLQPATINKFKVASKLGDTTDTFKSQVNPVEDLETIGKSGNEFLETNPNEISPERAQELKTGTYKQLQGKYGELSSARIESEKALARGLKEELETIFPDIKAKNKVIGEDLLLQEAMERAVNRIGNRDIWSLGGKVAAGAGAGAAGGGAIGALKGAAGAAFLHFVMSDPTVVSHLAIAMNKASKGSLSVPAALARITGYADVLGNSIDHHRSLSEQPQSTPAEIQVPTP